MSRETAEYDTQDFESRTAGDKSVYVRFYIRPLKDEAASLEEGRPIFRDREYVEIRAPGNANNVVQRPVTDMDKERFRHAYRAFRDGATEQDFGTPLTEVPWITRSQVEELAYLKVRTLEQLVNVGDDVCTRIPGLYQLKQKANVAIEKAEKNAPFIKMQAENEELKGQLAELKKAVEEQSAIIKLLQAKPAK